MNEVEDILDIFCYFESIIKGFLGLSRMRVTENWNLDQ